MNIKRLTALVLSIVIAPLALGLAGIDPVLLWEPRLLLIVCALPWILGALSLGAGTLTDAARTAFSVDVEDLPLDARQRAGVALRELGGLTLAVGAVVFLLEVLQLLNMIAQSGGQANPLELIDGLGSALLGPALLGPVYGVLLKALVYDPLANAAESTPSELAAEL